MLCILTSSSKAFDTVLLKLKAYGIQGKVLKLAKSFLNERKQQVSVNRNKSSREQAVSGVSQRSVLGPIHVVLYFNDLSQTIQSKIKLFADDTKLFHIIRGANDCPALQEEIAALDNWS